MEESDSSVSRFSSFIIATKKYSKVCTQHKLFEEKIVAFMAKAYTPLALVDCREFINLILLLDPRIVPVLRSLLSINFIPLKYESVKSGVMK